MFQNQLLNLMGIVCEQLKADFDLEVYEVKLCLTPVWMGCAPQAPAPCLVCCSAPATMPLLHLLGPAWIQWGVDSPACISAWFNYPLTNLEAEMRKNNGTFSCRKAVMCQCLKETALSQGRSCSSLLLLGTEWSLWPAVQWDGPIEMGQSPSAWFLFRHVFKM